MTGCKEPGDVYCNGCSNQFCRLHSFGFFLGGQLRYYVCADCMNYRLSHYTGITAKQFIPRTSLEP